MRRFTLSWSESYFTLPSAVKMFMAELMPSGKNGWLAAPPPSVP